LLASALPAPSPDPPSETGTAPSWDHSEGEEKNKLDPGNRAVKADMTDAVENDDGLLWLEPEYMLSLFCDRAGVDGPLNCICRERLATIALAVIEADDVTLDEELLCCAVRSRFPFLSCTCAASTAKSKRAASTAPARGYLSTIPVDMDRVGAEEV
jgi:hypothetical protein